MRYLLSRSKRPGEGGPPGSQGGGGNKAKIDEEYLSLMAELGEGEPPRHDHDSGSRFKSAPRLFENKGPMKAIMAPSTSSIPASSTSSSTYMNDPNKVLRNPPPPPPGSSATGIRNFLP